MRILAIRGRNLASLAGEFALDFTAEPLASAGLFAICGPTGAGKSTLLDALCLALYDRTPRLARATVRGAELPDAGEGTLSQGDARNVLRRGAAEGWAEVDFVGNEGAGYRARWSVRRARGHAAGRLQPAEMSLMRRADSGGNGGEEGGGDWQPVGRFTKTEVLAGIAERTGLSFEQFTRAVLLAQNDFAAFLKAPDDERAALLETLTGTEEFRALSIRAHERNRREQAELDGLRQRLAGQQPLADEARRQLAGERDRSLAALTEAERRRDALRTLLAWHEDHARAREAEARAQAEAAAARAACEQAGPRRRLLARIEAVQPARGLLQEGRRLGQESARAEAALQSDLAAQAAAHREADARRGHQARAADARSRAEASHRRLAPLLEQARALDATLRALQPGHDEAARALQAATAEAGTRRRQVDALERALHTDADALRGLDEWLAANEALRPLAREGARWELLYPQAAAARSELGQAGETLRLQAEALQQAEGRAARAAGEEAATAKAQAEAGSVLDEAERACAAFDPEALAERKAALEARREMLLDGAQRWRRRGEARERHAEAQRRAAGLERELGELRRQLDALEAGLPAARAAALQAERSWQLAVAAGTEAAQHLRASLQPGAPCPVCGSTEHPGAGSEHPLGAALQALEGERRRLQSALAEQETAFRSGRQMLDLRAREQAELAPQLEARALELRDSEALWQAHPAAQEPVDEAARTAWFDAAGAEARQQLDALAGEEQRHRHAQRQRDACRRSAQEAAERARAAGERARAAAFEREAAVRAHEAAREACEGAAARLEALLAQLEPAASVGGGAGWREAWQADPDAFHRARRQEAEACTARERQADELRRRLATAEVELRAAREALATAGRTLEERGRVFEEARRGIEEGRRQRAAVFVGVFAEPAEAQRSADAIEQASAQALRTACEAEEAAAAALARATADLASRTALAQESARRREDCDRQLAQAGERLAGWLEAFNRGEAAGDDRQPLDRAGLEALLDQDDAALVELRRGLRELDERLDRAAVVAQERRRQLAELEQRRPGALELGAPQAAQALQALEAELGQARQRLAEQEGELRRDDDRRRLGAELGAAVQAQQERARLWARLDELIGSADGRKFRNQAQQITLDVLLAHANHHLQQLARRYRLQRLDGSLGLAVRDRDMGDEIRSVHSLSGGESFLVSLALALGLASLSSQRVRVESLFIDEGFGSLDADTLAVAMDALDRLQSQGRKVGVISHVQEMTERIPTRVQVRRGAGSMSRVEVKG